MKWNCRVRRGGVLYTWNGAFWGNGNGIYSKTLAESIFRDEYDVLYKVKGTFEGLKIGEMKETDRGFHFRKDNNSVLLGVPNNV